MGTFVATFSGLLGVENRAKGEKNICPEGKLANFTCCKLPRKIYTIHSSHELELEQALKRASSATGHALEAEIRTGFFEQSDEARYVPFARVVYGEHHGVFVPVFRESN